jgi:NAD(P)-dependent dehydrogenase (short-subunit alcohol dehydrogenase family)
MDTVIVTGGASGIGRAAAERLAKRMHVVVADKDKAGADKLAATLPHATAVELDVSDAASVRRMMQGLGPVHALFNNAGINRRARVEDITEADWDLMMATHVKGMFLCTQAVLPQMVARNSGAIVNTASDFSVMGVAGLAAYTAAKTAIYSLTKSLALEFAPHNIRVNAIGPGPIDTPLLRKRATPAEEEAALRQNVARIPMGRLGRPDEVAYVVDFLLSEKSSYITGQIIHPNGGALTW